MITNNYSWNYNSKQILMMNNSIKYNKWNKNIKFRMKNFNNSNSNKKIVRTK